MSGLNASLGYFVAVVVFGALIRVLLRKWPRFSFLSEFSASFVLTACWLEVQTILEVGQWAGGLGRDVTVTMLFVVLLTHGIMCGSGTGNPNLALMNFLELEATILPTVLAVAAQLLGAYAAIPVAGYYWNLELTDMHMIKNLMSRECSTSLKVSLPQGFFAECLCAVIFHLLHLCLRRRSVLIRVPLVAALLTYLSDSASNYTSAYVNPSLAYGLTFQCSGFTFSEYALVYWLGPLTGMILALFIYLGHIPRIFSRNLLYSPKTRFKVPKGNALGSQEEKKKK